MRELVDDVEREIEVVRMQEFDGNGRPVLVFDHLRPLLVDAVLGFLAQPAGDLRGFRLLRHELGNGLAGGIEHDGVEEAVLAADGRHTVGL